jgi:hypothetical protein
MDGCWRVISAHPKKDPTETVRRIPKGGMAGLRGGGSFGDRDRCCESTVTRARKLTTAERQAGYGNDLGGGGGERGLGLVEMDELVFCLPEKKWMSIYVHWAHRAACGHLGP